MAAKNPLIRYSDTGKTEELRAGDTVNGAGSDGTAFSFFMG